QRIRGSLERLTTFAAAGRPLEGEPPRTLLQPSLSATAREVGLTTTGAIDPELRVRCGEAALLALLRDLFASCVPPGGAAAGGGAAGGGAPLDHVEIEPSGMHVRISVVRALVGDPDADPFDPQLSVPGSEHPGLDLRLATVRRRVEGCGGRVGTRRTRAER